MSKSLRNISKTLLALTMVAGMASGPLLSMQPSEAAQGAATQSKNPFQRVNYFGDKIVMKFELGDYSLEFDCGPGGSGDIKEKLEEITMRVTKNDHETFSSWGDDEEDSGSTVSLAEVMATLSTRLTKAFPMLTTAVSLVGDIIDKTSIEEKIPVGANLLLRTLIVLNSNLDGAAIGTELITLLGRYKLSLLKDKALITAEEALTTVEKDLATKKGTVDTLEKTNPKNPTAIESAQKAVVVAQKVVDEARAKINTLEPKGRITALYEQFRNKAFGTTDETTLVKSSIEKTGYGWIWDIFSKNHDINELTQKEKDELAKTDVNDTVTGPIAFKLILRSLQNVHNDIARRHQDLLKSDAAYKIAYESRQAKIRSIFSFKNTAVGIAAHEKALTEIAKIKTSYTKPTGLDKENFLTRDLEAKIKLRNQLRTFYVLEKVRTSKLITSKPAPMAGQETIAITLQAALAKEQGILKGLLSLQEQEEAKATIDEAAIITLQAQINTCEQTIAEIENKIDACTSSKSGGEEYKIYLLKLDAVIKKITDQNKTLNDLLVLRKKTTKTAKELEDITKLTPLARSSLVTLFPLPANNEGVPGPIENLEITLNTPEFAAEKTKFFNELKLVMEKTGYQPTTTGVLDGCIKLPLKYLVAHRKYLKSLYNGTLAPASSVEDLEYQ